MKTLHPDASNRQSMIADWRLKILAAIVVIATLVILLAGPIAQPLAYHRFADQRTIAGIAHFYNVLSNLPFAVVGIMGMHLVAQAQVNGGFGAFKPIYFTFFLGVMLTAFGSAYYHHHPDNATLVWDRLPMTLAFMAFFCAVLGEYVGQRLALRLFAPSLVLGVASVWYWDITELRGSGDLRAYLLVQFLPVVLLPLILSLYESKFHDGKYLWGVLGAYALSKLAEFYDAGIYGLLGIFSGHTLKHLLAALGAYIFYCALQGRSASK